MFNFDGDNKKKIIFAISIFVIILCIVIILLTLNKGKEVIETPVINDEIVEEIPKIGETDEPVIEEKQQEAVSVIKARVTGIVDNVSTIQFKVAIGVGENEIQSSFLANSNTVVYDAVLERVIGVKGIKENMEVTFFGRGNYKVENLVANAVVLGNANNLKFGLLSEIYIENEEMYVGKIADTNEYINISSNTIIENGFTGMDVLDLNIIKSNSSILFYIEPEFEQTKDGIFYDVNKIVIVKE